MNCDVLRLGSPNGNKCQSLKSKPYKSTGSVFVRDRETRSQRTLPRVFSLSRFTVRLFHSHSLSKRVVCCVLNEPERNDTQLVVK